MAKLIEITKHSEKDSIHYYFVSTDDFGRGRFFVGIDSVNKRVLFYEKDDFKELLGVYDMLKPSKDFKAGSINLRVVPYVLIKAYKTVKDNNFPECLDYIA